MKLFRSIATLSGFTILSRIFGLIRDILIASILGASPMADAFFVAFRLPNFFRRLFAEGAFNAAFIPTYASLEHKKGQATAVECAENVKGLLALTLVGLVLFVIIFIPQLMFVIAPGFADTPERFEWTVTFTRITFPSILFMSLAALYTGILNTHHKFVAGVAAPILLNIFMIAALVWFLTTFETPAHALSWAILLAAIAQMLWVKQAVHMMGIDIRFRWPKISQPVRHMLRLMGPGAIAASMIQINMLISGIFLSFLIPGAVAYFSYADRLNQLPLSLVGVAISTALLPTLSHQFHLKDLSEAINTQNRALEFSFLLIIPAAVGLYILAEPIMNVVYGRGSFSYGDVVETGKILKAFVLGLPAYGMVKVLSTGFFARHNTKTPLHATLAAVITNVIFNFVLFKPMGYVGIALATSIGSWVNAGWLMIQLKNHDFFKADRRLWMNTPKIIFASGLMGAFVFYMAEYFYAFLFGHEIEKISCVGLIIISGMVVYFLGLWVMGALSAKDIKAYVGKKA